MLGVLLLPSSDTFVQHEDGYQVISKDDPLQPGHYIVWADDFQINNEIVLTRALSVTTGPRLNHFRENVQRRDGRCVVSKLTNNRADRGNWSAFQAAHIFPLAYQQQWIDGDYGRDVTIVPSIGGRINSVQNGLLLLASVHVDFDNYHFSINVDNGYKVVLFEPDNLNIAGQALDRRLLDDPSRPLDSLLRWHFRQAVLANMRGAGEPIFENDFPSYSDMMGEIMEGPKAAQRMEFELFNRLGAFYDLGEPHEADHDEVREMPKAEGMTTCSDQPSSPICEDMEEREDMGKHTHD
ncbi:hypothetical protein CMQ_7759 [Grosmannia clavigera kw1407]|uniref:HNH nuclease domain-containing protein n=1 Tax=Grosmannia clavigera (strain kw1407 / UAMH 11150) TaxID=655863 RepID=F0XRW0_GROCL|nr:uncharacterized protein CMQ_7759 [Grosmannia clavigera kw1407]EFW99391.1 hypothetical protein CMQ_7759 [Grosmannia clavigera kw1407]